MRRLLTFSRKQPLEFKPFDLNQVVSKFEKLLKRTIREDICIINKQGMQLPPVCGDVGQLEQVYTQPGDKCPEMPWTTQAP